MGTSEALELTTRVAGSELEFMTINTVGWSRWTRYNLLPRAAVRN
jgi:hypothetical protein